jgi:hypothetical protein
MPKENDGSHLKEFLIFVFPVFRKWTMHPYWTVFRFTLTTGQLPNKKINRWDLSAWPSSALGFNWVDVGQFSTAQRSFLYIFFRITSISGFGELKP